MKTGAEKDRARIVRLIRDKGYKMTPAERKALVAEVDKAVGGKFGHLIPHRFDKRYRRIYGYGDRHRPVAFGYAGAGCLIEENGRVRYSVVNWSHT